MQRGSRRTHLLGDVDVASLYRKKNSPYWFVQFIDSNGKRRNKSIELRTDNPGETTQARALRGQFEAKELMRTGAVEGDGCPRKQSATASTAWVW